MIGYRVTGTIEGAHPKLSNYPLLSGDLLVKHPNGTWAKEAPGLCVVGFILTPEQESVLEEVKFNRHGLEYKIEEL